MCSRILDNQTLISNYGWENVSLLHRPLTNVGPVLIGFGVFLFSMRRRPSCLPIIGKLLKERGFDVRRLPQSQYDRTLKCTCQNLANIEKQSWWVLTVNVGFATEVEVVDPSREVGVWSVSISGSSAQTWPRSNAEEQSADARAALTRIFNPGCDYQCLWDGTLQTKVGFGGSKGKKACWGDCTGRSVGNAQSESCPFRKAP